MPEFPLHLGIPGQENNRNTIVTHATDTDQGPFNNPPEPAQHTTFAGVAGRLLIHMAQLVDTLKDQGFDYSHPVDEYAPQGMAAFAGATYPNVINIQADYDMPEKIESITVIVPVGCTFAVLQLGQRTLNVYSGAALTTPYLFTIPFAGVIVNSDDPRTLTLTGTLTSAPYLGLSGFALTRGQFS
jgi:hypothetical protein